MTKENVNLKRIQEMVDQMLLDREHSHRYENKEIKITRNQIKKQKKVNQVLKELDCEHNHSWYREIYECNKDNLDAIALFYRGTKITYREMFEKADTFAASLLAIGIEPKEKIATCVSNTPEFIYALLGANRIGVILNIFGDDFSSDYIDDILKSCSEKLVIVSDDHYEKLEENLKNRRFSKTIIVPLAESQSPYVEIKYEFVDCLYDRLVEEQKDKIKSTEYYRMNDFMKIGEKRKSMLEQYTPTLDDVFAHTYSSGSTKIGRPKEIVHKNRGPISMARFHKKDISGLPSTKGVRALAMIPTHSYTNLSACISDPLSQGGTVTLEPIYHELFFPHSLHINKPEFAPATRSFWLKAAKLYEQNVFPDEDLSYIHIPTIVGEASSRNEEKYLNEVAKKMKIGRKKIPLPVQVCTFSIGGGDCEHGGLFFTLYKATVEKLLRQKEGRGLVPFALAECVVVDKNQTPVGSYQLGKHMWTSVANMKGYYHNDEANQNFFVKDSNGKTWGDGKVWGYQDENGHVFMKGRMGDEFHVSGKELPTFLLADTILLDMENILSCEVINYKNPYNGEEIPVAHIEFHPNKKLTVEETLEKAQKRIEEVFPRRFAKNVMYRVRSYGEGFPLTGCGKRNVKSLEEEGIEHAFTYREMERKKNREKKYTMR